MTRHAWHQVVRYAAFVVVAGFCATVFHARVYNEFDRVRVRVVTTPQIAVDGTLDVPLPAVDGLAHGPIAIILRLRSDSLEATRVRVSVRGTEVGQLVIRPRQTIRVDFSVTAQPSVSEGDRIQLTGDGDDWVLQYLELANVHGFSHGLFSFVVTPASAMRSDEPSGIAAFVVFGSLLAFSIPLFWLDRRRAIRVASLIPGTAVLCFLCVTLVLPWLSVYQLLLSVQAFSLCMMGLYGPPAVTEIARRVAIVARPLVASLRAAPYRKYLASLGEIGTGFVVWPFRGLSYLAFRVRRRPAWSIGAVVGSALLLSVLVTSLASTPQTYPVGDKALLETYTLHAAHGSLRVGAYSRFLWNHPGPVYFYALAPLYVLTGGREFSLDWTALLINLVSAFAIVALAARYGGWPFGVGMIAALSIYFFRPGPGLYAGFGSLLSSPWNPHIPMLPLALLLVLCASLASGRLWALPGVALVSSFIIQTHVGMGPCVVAAVMVAVLLLVTMHKRTIDTQLEAQIVPRGRPAEFWIFATAWLLVLLWCLPLTEQVWSGGDGNLAAIASMFWSEPLSETPSLTAAFSALSYAFSAAIWPDARVARGASMLSTGDFALLSGIWVLLQLALLTAACVWSVTKQRVFPAALCVICLATSGVAFWSITQVREGIREGLVDYLAFWISIIAVVNLAAIIGVFLSWASETLCSSRIRIPSVAGQVAIVGFCCLLTVHGVSHLQNIHQRTLRGEGQFARRRQVSRLLSVALKGDLRNHGTIRPLIRMREQTWSPAAGVVLQLYKAGIPLAVENQQLFFFTDVFAATGEEDVEFLFTHGVLHGEPGDEPPYRLVAREGATALYRRSLSASSTGVP